MTDKTVALPEQRHGGFIKNNLRDYGMLLSLFAIMLFFQIVTDGTLLQPLNLTNLVLQNSYIVIMALGMLLVIVTGHIDLSVGSVAGFVGAVAAVLMVRYQVDYPIAFIACLLVGAAIGAAQGYWVAYFADPLLYRHAGRHAGVQGPCARAAAGPVGGTVSAGLPETVVGLHSGVASRRDTLDPTSLLIGAVLTLALVYSSAKGRAREQSHGIEVEPYRVLCREDVGAVGPCSLHLPDRIASRIAERPRHHDGPDRALRLRDAANGDRPAGSMRSAAMRKPPNCPASRPSGSPSSPSSTWGLWPRWPGSSSPRASIRPRRRRARASNSTSSPPASSAARPPMAASAGSAGAVIGAMIMGVMNNGMSILGIGIDYQQVIKGLVLLGAVCIDVYNQRR